MKQIIRFIKFETTEEFEDWQDDNEILIHQISPVALQADAKKTDAFGMSIDFGVFVAYVDKPKV